MMDRKEILKEWRYLVNMSAMEVSDFLDTPEGKSAGLSPSEAREAGVRSGQISANYIIVMKGINPNDWSDYMWDWAKAQVNFIKRMRGVKGPLIKSGKPTRKYLALKLWGHDPMKK